MIGRVIMVLEVDRTKADDVYPARERTRRLVLTR
jgi:hypothetical protein